MHARSLAVLGLACVLGACASTDQPAPAPESPEEPVVLEEPAPEPPPVMIPAGEPGIRHIAVNAVATGTGRVARTGDRVSVHYVGTLANGHVFDSSRDRDEPFVFRVGTGAVIRGWDLTVSHMRVGDRWVVRIPSALAYGSAGAGGVIPPNADLTFDIEVLAIQ